MTHQRLNPRLSVRIFVSDHRVVNGGSRDGLDKLGAAAGESPREEQSND